MQVKRIDQSIVRGIAKEISITDRRPQRGKRDFRGSAPFFAAVSRVASLVSTISGRRALTAIFVAAVLLAAGRGFAFSAQLVQDPAAAAQSAPLTPAALQQLLAPIALYPDALVAQILAASTYPSQIVEADRWLQDHSKLKDDKLAKEVDKQSWDPSVKALTPFASVLANLDKNLSWTSALGDAYFNQQQDVLDALQSLRTRAKDAGHLQSTTEQTVTSQGPTIIIEPADPDVCYVPSYNPWLVYGSPIGIYPGYLYDAFIGGPYVSFGLGIGIGGGFWGGFGWGWDAWGFNWRNRTVIFNHNTYVSRSRTFFHRFAGGDRGDRGNFGRGQDRSSFQGNHQPGDVGRNRDGASTDRNSDRNRTQGSPNDGISHDRSGTMQTGNSQNRRDYRGFGQASPNPGTRSGAFSGFGQGGIERGSASRGRASFGGGGGFGGGRGGGGGGRGGGRH